MKKSNSNETFKKKFHDQIIKELCPIASTLSTSIHNQQKKEREQEQKVHKKEM